MQAIEGPMRASVELAKAEKTALLNIAAQVAPAESERAELASRRAALEARVKSEESNVALLEAEAALFEALSCASPLRSTRDLRGTC